MRILTSAVATISGVCLLLASLNTLGYCQEVKKQKATYTVEAFPKKGLPGINTYLLVRAESESLDKREYGFYRLAERSNQQVTVYRDILKKEELASYKTGEHDPAICRTARREPTVITDHVCILVNAEASSYPRAHPLVLKLKVGPKRVAEVVNTKLIFDKLTIEEKTDYDFLKRQELLGTFRSYYPYHPDHQKRMYIEMQSFQNLYTTGNYDRYANAMPDVVIDVNPTLNTIETIFTQVKKRDSKRSRYIPYMQAKLIYDLGLYQTKLEKSTPAELVKLTPLPDTLRNDILRYLETELTKKPSPLLQYHYANYVASDEERSLSLLQEVYKNTDDSYLNQLAEQGIALIERQRLLRQQPQQP